MVSLGDIASRIFGHIYPDVPPSQVLAVKQDKYSNRHIHFREEGIMLYGPHELSNNTYELVLNRPYQESMHEAFSLFRCDDLDVTITRFTIYKDKIPILVQTCKELSTVAKIQKLCDTLKDNPTWTAAHLAAYLGLSDAFRNPVVLSELNSGDSTTGISPLQLAIQTNNLQLVQQLKLVNASLIHRDHENKTVYHYAAASTKDIILALVHGEEYGNYLNSRDVKGQTPLHVACQNDKPDCVKALLNIGADVNMSASGSVVSGPSYVGNLMSDKPNSFVNLDIKFGGTPLHWSSSCEVINALIEMNCNIDALNFDGRTALHIMVMRKRLDCIVALLSHMASVNIADNEGNTPLHLAVKSNGLLSIVKILIGFGANINAKNFKNESPRHLIDYIRCRDVDKILYALHAVGAQRCEQNMDDCHIGCKFNETFDGVAPPKPSVPDCRKILDEMLYGSSMAKMALEGSKLFAGGRLLCLDGGGIRGLVLVQILLEIEAVLNQPIVSYFDWIAGTSTGGIIALGMASGKNLRECQALYFRIKQNVFVGSRPYNSEYLENILKECLGADTMMSDIETPKLIITTVLADRKPVDLHIFRNYQSPISMMKNSSDSQFKPTFSPEMQHIWKVARATGAAPSYFRPFGRFLDGGLIANNPTLDAMTEIYEYNLSLKALGRHNEVTPLSLVVSLGTGAIPVTPLNDIDVFHPESIWGAIKLGKGISTLANLLVDQATCSDGRVVDRARSWCSMIGVPYFRFHPQLSTAIAMDEKNDEVLADMIWTVKAYMYAKKDQINELVAVLTNNS